MVEARWRGVIAALGVGAVACVSWFDLPEHSWDPPIRAAESAPLLVREPCALHTGERSAWFGDLHVHTGFSMDARVRGLTLMPDDAYRFAKGEPLLFPPLDDVGLGTRPVRIDRPLDFAAVTDHAELLAETALCTVPDSPAYDSGACRTYRGEARSLISLLAGDFQGRLGTLMLNARGSDICGDDGRRCRARSASAWEVTKAAAERHYDRSSECRFTTFHAWEHSASPQMSKVHRNVVFRSEITPELPISALEEPTAEGLWRKLDALCMNSGTGCDAFTIPHNPNLSNGKLFALHYRGAPHGQQAERARLRARHEPLVEMMQAKGESECRNGLFEVEGGPDELCDFEKIRGLGDASPPDCEEGQGNGALAGSGCVSRKDYARYALIEGLREETRIGVNPLRFGVIGSTDTHNASPGAVAEASFEGTRWTESATAEQRLSEGSSGIRREFTRNPGGLVGVFAEENSRESLFGAMRRRETFATSGTRVRPRFFGGWELSGRSCAEANLAAYGYEHGVPMGGLLPAAPKAAGAPRFVVSALADHAPLQRVQIIKGWVGAEGHYHQSVVDVAGFVDLRATVDLATCEPTGPGHRALCGSWQDPDFDPGVPAVYYARVLENPSCRWTAWQCLSLPEAERPATCHDEGIPSVIQERAWTSPIWYSPEEGRAS
jgi:hypothetical protein